MKNPWRPAEASPHVLVGILILALGCHATEKVERLLAILPAGESFQQALSGMKSDLGVRYTWKTFDPDTRNAQDSLVKLCTEYAPRGLVLMDFRAVALAKRMQARDSIFAALPKFVLMTLKAEDATRGLRNTLGVRFEVPAYAVFTQLRTLSETEFTRIGVFHRRIFSDFVEDSRRLLSREKLELVGHCIDCDGDEPLSEEEIIKRRGKGWEKLRDADVEVVWMLPDNAMVNAVSLEKFWIPRFRRSKVPLVVPLAHLAGKQTKLGLYSAYPDYFQLGIQAAQQVVHVLEEEADPSTLGFESLISVQTTFNLGVAKRLRWEIRKERLHRVGDLVPP